MYWLNFQCKEAIKKLQGSTFYPSNIGQKWGLCDHTVCLTAFLVPVQSQSWTRWCTSAKCPGSSATANTGSGGSVACGMKSILGRKASLAWERPEGGRTGAEVSPQGALAVMEANSISPLRAGVWAVGGGKGLPPTIQHSIVHVWTPCPQNELHPCWMQPWATCPKLRVGAGTRGTPSWSLPTWIILWSHDSTDSQIKLAWLVETSPKWKCWFSIP